MLNYLVDSDRIDWEAVTMFHLDEYIGIGEDHPASFRRYLRERFLEQVSQLKAAHLVNGEGDPEAECHRLGELIRDRKIDVACVGIGENGHLAFNDPPADFETEEPFLVVNLDEACRRQQWGEGWFHNLSEVPRRAISMSVRKILKSEEIVVSVPDERKAVAVKACVEGPVSNRHPASILQTHERCYVYCDRSSASLFAKEYAG